MLFQLRSSDSRLVNSDSGDISSEMLLPERSSDSRLVNSDSGDISSEMLLPERSSLSRLVNLDRPEISEMLFLLRSSLSRLVNPDIADTSEILFLLRSSLSRLVKPDNGERSEIELLLVKLLTVSGPKFRFVRREANSSPVKSLMFAFGASRRIKVDISPLVIGAPRVLPRLSSITARRFVSGITTCIASPVSGGDTSLPKLLLKVRKSLNPIAPSLSRSYLASYLPSP